MKVLNEAIVGEYHFVVSDEYLVITLDGKEMVHLSSQEANEVVPWLMGKIGTVAVPKEVRETRQAMPVDDPKAHKSFVGPDPFAGRSASQTVPMRVGNPDAIPPMANNTGQRIVGVETMDLAAEMRKTGIPILGK